MMPESDKLDQSLVSVSDSLSTLNTETNKVELDKEAASLLNQLIQEHNTDRTQDLTNLFNINQNKKIAIRANKLNDLLDLITEQAITRFSSKPDEISNQELLQAMKVVQDNLEKSQHQINSSDVQPLIQINQQHNEVNLKDPNGLNRESREKVKSAVLNILNGITQVSEAKVSEDNLEPGDIIKHD